MPVIQKQVTVPLNGAIENVLAGSAFEFLRGNAVVSLGITAEATGVVGNIQSGSDVVLEESDVAIKPTFPVVPDEMYYNDVGVQGDRLVVRLRNTTAGDITARVIAQISQIR